jgi:hypothetical protein
LFFLPLLRFTIVLIYAIIVNYYLGCVVPIAKRDGTGLQTNGALEGAEREQVRL